MKIRFAVYLSLIIFGLGFFVGYFVSDHCHDRVERSMALQLPEAKADIAIRALKFIREGNTNAVPFLETELDVAIIDLNDCLKNAKLSQTDTQMLAIARDYRTKYPWVAGQPELDGKVQSAFLLLDKQQSWATNGFR